MTAEGGSSAAFGWLIPGYDSAKISIEIAPGSLKF
jgi:hypothetical protein